MANPFDALDGAVVPGDSLTARDPTWLEKFGAAFQATRAETLVPLTGGVGAVQGATTDQLEKQKLIDAYDAMPQWEGDFSTGSAYFLGGLAAQATALENYTPVGAGEKVAAWLGIKSAPVLARVAAGAVDAGIMGGAQDAAVQAIEAGHGQRQAIDPWQLAESIGLSAVGGGLLHGLFGGKMAPKREPLFEAGHFGDQPLPQAPPMAEPAHVAPAPDIVAPPVPGDTMATAGSATGQMVPDVRAQADVSLGDLLDARAREARGLGPSTVAEPASPAGVVPPVEIPSYPDWVSHMEVRRDEAINAKLQAISGDQAYIAAGGDLAHAPSHTDLLAGQPRELLALPDKDLRTQLITMLDGEARRYGEMVGKPLAADPQIKAVYDGLKDTGVLPSSGAGAGALKRPATGIATSAEVPAFTRVKDIGERLATALDATAVRMGRFRTRVGQAKAAGIYKTLSGVIRLARPDDFDTLTHELGHHLEAAIGSPLENLKSTHAAELTPMAYANAKPGTELSEGFAEFLRTYVTNPAYARTKAPRFAAAFDQYLAKDHPQVASALDDAANAWRHWLNQPSTDAVASTIVSARKPGIIEKWQKELKGSGLGNTILERLQGLYASGLDDLHPLSRAVRMLATIYRDNHGGKRLDLKVSMDAAKLARLARNSYGRGYADIVSGVTPYGRFDAVGPSLRDAVVTALGKPNALSGWDDTMMQRFGAYLWSRRALGEWERLAAGEIPNPPDKLTRGDHVQNVADSEKAFAGFKPAADMIYQWATALWDKKRDAGLITPDQHAAGLKIKDYVPGLRARDLEGDPAGATTARKGGSTKHGYVRQFRGSMRDVINPVESLAADAFNTAQAIARNDAVRALDTLAQLAGRGGGAIAERIPAHQMQAFRINTVDALAAIAKQTGMSDDEWLTVRDLAESTLGDEQLALWRPAVANEKGEPIVFFREGGELRAVRLADGDFGQEMFTALAGFTPQQSNLFFGLLTRPAAISRLGVVLDPAFVVRNALRDLMTTVVYYGKPFQRLGATATGFADEVLQRDAARLYNMAGGVSGGAFSQVQHELRGTRDLNLLRNQGWGVSKFTSLRGWMEVTEISETAMRLGLMKTFYDEAAARGLSRSEALLEAGYRARDHQDFSRHGSRMAALTRAIPFFNASLQGIDKMTRQMIVPFLREAVTAEDVRARGVAAKSWARLAAAAVGWMGIHALMSEDDTYRDAQNLRARNFVFRYGDNFVAVPKPYELSVAFNGAEAIYDAWAKNDPRAAVAFRDAMMTAFAPPDLLQGNPTLKTAIELRTGKDTWSGNDIVPDNLKGLEPTLQYTARTGEIAKSIGAALGLPPVWVEQVMLNYSTSLGKAVSSMYDYALGDKPLPGWDDVAITNSFIKDTARGATSTHAFWTLVSSRTGSLEGARRSYQALADGGDPASAADFLAKQDQMTRDWIAAGTIKADARRIHPLARAQLAVTAIAALRREMAQDMITTADGKHSVPRVDRGAADDILEHLGMTLARNALVMMKVPGWADRQLMDETGYYRELQAASPLIARALADRFATGHVLPQEDVLKLWPELQQRLQRDGSGAQVLDLAAVAKAAGSEGQGSKIKRRPRALVPPVGDTSPSN